MSVGSQHHLHVLEEDILEAAYEHYDAANDAPLTVATGAGFVEKLALPIPELRGGRYRLSGSYTYRANATGVVNIRARLIDLFTIHRISDDPVLTTGSVPGAFEFFVDYPAATPFLLDLDIQSTGLLGTATILESRLSVERVGL